MELELELRKMQEDLMTDERTKDAQVTSRVKISTGIERMLR